MLLTQIRRALPRPDLLVTADDTIGLDQSMVETDTAVLAAQLPQDAGVGLLDQLAGAQRQYRGPFLDGFTLPDSACTSYRTLFAELVDLEADILRHVHVENHVLLQRFA